MTTAYVGNYFEWTGSTSTMVKYYYAGSQRVAMRQGSTLYWLLSDHLGSANLVANSSGQEVSGSRTYYAAFGDTRYGGGSLSTDRRFTGQQRVAALGLYYYGARWYDSSLGRFLSADTIVPSLGNPQSLNRYAYTLNNPLKYVDPSGHMTCLTDDSFCVRSTDDGGLRVVQGGSVFAGETEELLANFYLSGNEAYLTHIREGNPEFMRLAIENVETELGIRSNEVIEFVALAIAADHSAKKMREVNEGVGASDVLVRRGTSWESAERLSRQAQAAEKAGFPHGVSVTTPESNARLARDPLDVSMATRQAFEEAGFPVHYTPTNSDPWHHTVELPKLITSEIARIFNLILGRSK